MKLSFYSIAIILILLKNILHVTVVTAADFYVDPVNGSMQGDGSAERPWSTLEEVWNANKIHTQVWSTPYTTTSTLLDKNTQAPVKPGDTIYLLSGYHGDVQIVGAVNNDTITVKAVSGASPKLKRLLIRSASNWIFEGLSISPSHAEPFSTIDNIVYIDNHDWTGPSSNITIKNCDIFSVNDISGWTANDWNTNASSGMYIDGIYTAVDNVRLRNIGMGISIDRAHHTIIKNTKIENFCADGIRIIGANYTKIEHNIVKNVYTVLDYSVFHYDLIQAWTLDGDVEGVEIRGNILIAHEDPNQPLKETVQGIGFFDGWFDNFVIENNLLITDGYHGISLYGARNCKVVNNTVVDTPIKVYPHKDGSPGEGNTIRNNFAGLVSVTDNGISSGTVVENNIAGFVQSDHFNNPSVFDFSLKAGSSAINTGSALSPTTDITGYIRDATPDIGAYEYRAEPRRLFRNVRVGEVEP